MKKFKSILMGTAALLAFTACSSDEPTPGTGSGETTSPTDVLYFYVDIKSGEDVGSRTTTGSINDKEYIFGDGKENEVKNAFFHFYNADGKYSGISSNSWTTSVPGTDFNPNVEIIGKNTIILKGMTGKSYPKWVVTILNQPLDFTPAATLDEMQTQLLDSYKNAEGAFIMTTSSYFGSDDDDISKDNRKLNELGEPIAGQWNYFATKLQDSNFYEEETSIPETERVQIYVERLAVRIGVDIKDMANAKHPTAKYTYTDAEGKEQKADLYEITATVGGDDNGNIGGDTPTAATKLYVAITGWNVVNTAKRTNLVKDLSAWSEDTKFGNTNWTWNIPDNHRSFWGKSYTYGVSGEALRNRLNVKSHTWTDLNEKVGTEIFNGSRAYCNENTNTADNISLSGALDPSKTTTVLLQAVVCDQTGKALEIVTYHGVNYLKDSFVKHALSLLDLQYYKREQRMNPDGTPVKGDKSPEWTEENPQYEPVYDYTQLGADDVKLVFDAEANINGAVKITLKDDGATFYTVSDPVEKTDGNGDKYIVYNATELDNNVVKGALARATEGVSNLAVCRTDGAMFYTIPVEHLNNDGDNKALVEAEAGVVRNHVYNISLKKISSLGEGVFTPRKLEDGTPAEILDPTNPKTTLYYVESTINILSWKVVSQVVEDI